MAVFVPQTICWVTSIPPKFAKMSWSLFFFLSFLYVGIFIEHFGEFFSLSFSFLSLLALIEIATHSFQLFLFLGYINNTNRTLNINRFSIKYSRNVQTFWLRATMQTNHWSAVLIWFWLFPRFNWVNPYHYQFQPI